MPNDFQPRANIKKMFSDGVLTTEEELQQFLEKFDVELHLIKAYIVHLEDLKIQSGIRTRGRAEQKRKMMSKTFEEYAWRNLVESGDLKKLLVSELNKYLKHYKAAPKLKRYVESRCTCFAGTMVNRKIRMSLLTRRRRNVERKMTARKLTAQGTMKVRRILSLENF